MRFAAINRCQLHLFSQFFLAVNNFFDENLPKTMHRRSLLNDFRNVFIKKIVPDQKKLQKTSEVDND